MSFGLHVIQLFLEWEMSSHRSLQKLLYHSHRAWMQHEKPTLPDGQLSEITAAGKASAGFWYIVNKPKWCLSQLWAFLFKTKQVVLFLDKFLTHWLKAAALKSPQFFQMPKRLTKAHTSVSQLATCGRLDQSFVKTLLKTFLLLMLHFKSVSLANHLELSILKQLQGNVK